MSPMLMPFNPAEFLIDCIYSFIVLLSCFLIYFKTKELYDLTSHRGIKYFRGSFLFFGIASLIRFAAHFFREYGIRPVFSALGLGIFGFALLVMIYSSSLAMIYMIYSIFWKKFDRAPFNRDYFPHILAVMIAILSMARIPALFFIFQAAWIVILITVICLAYANVRKKGRFSGLYLIYLLMFGLLIASNILEFLSFFTPLSLFVYIVATPLFIILLYRVLRDLNSDSKRKRR